MRQSAFPVAVLLVLALFIGDCRQPLAAFPAYLRLHVVAHSDSAKDQEIKLSVRDLVLAELNVPLKETESFADAQQYCALHLEQLNNEIESFLKSIGYENQVKTRLVKEEFPAMKYGDFYLPAGRYLALRVTIGAGAGHNWWCVLFPPLCLAELKEANAVPVMSGTRSGQEGDSEGVWEKIKRHYSKELRKIWLMQ